MFRLIHSLSIRKLYYLPFPKENIKIILLNHFVLKICLLLQLIVCFQIFQNAKHASDTTQITIRNDLYSVK